MGHSPYTRRRAIALYTLGGSSHEVAAELDVDPTTAQRWARQAGVIRGHGPRGRTDVDTRLIVELRDVEQLTFDAIATEVGMSRTGVRMRYHQATTEGWQRPR